MLNSKRCSWPLPSTRIRQLSGKRLVLCSQGARARRSREIRGGAKPIHSSPAEANDLPATETVAAKASGSDAPDGEHGDHGAGHGGVAAIVHATLQAEEEDQEWLVTIASATRSALQQLSPPSQARQPYTDAQFSDPAVCR